MKEEKIKKKIGRPLGRKDSKPRRPAKENIDNLENPDAVRAACARRSNLASKEVKDAIAKFVKEKIEDLEKAYSTCPDLKEKGEFIVKLLPYVLPKMSSTDINANLEVESVGDELAKLARTTPTVERAE